MSPDSTETLHHALTVALTWLFAVYWPFLVWFAVRRLAGRDGAVGDDRAAVGRS